MIRKSALILLIPILFCVCQSSREKDVHYSIDYIDAGQTPVPPEAISPYEPKDVTYLDEPSVELDSDWNLDVKLFSKYRYTNKFAQHWQEKFGYSPARPMMTDAEFFNAVDLDYPGLEKIKTAIDNGDFSDAREEYLLYHSKRPRPNHLKPVGISKEYGEASVKEADRIMADPKFPACRPGKDYSLFRLSGHLERAYLHTKEAKYAKAWLEMFTYWYETKRPPAQRLKAYIGFIFVPNWSTLAAEGSAVSLCENECRFAPAGELGLDNDKIFNIYKSILEHAEFLYLNNDAYMPSNWQLVQCEAILKIGAYFPSFKQSQFWCEHAWKLIQEHMVKETFDDGTSCENSVNYGYGVVVRHNFNIVQVVRKLGLKIPNEFIRKWKLMYIHGTKIITPTHNSVPIGDGGIGPNGYLVKGLLIPGALEFSDPTMKYFTEQYPDDVKKFAEEQFENTEKVLAAYNKVKAKKPSFTSILLPDADWAVMRHSWEKDSPYLFFDGGWDETWHSHPDFGNFNVWAYGKPLITDCGRTGPYEADISKRWYKQTIAHNTVMVDSRSMRKCINNRITKWWTGAEYDFVDAISDGYRWVGVLHNRRVLFIKPGYWIISDFLPGPSYYNSSFQTTGFHEFDWLAHFQPTTLKIDKNTKRVDTTNEDVNVALVPLNFDEVQVKESKGPTNTPTSMVETPYISLHQERMAFVQYQVLLLPYKGSQAPKINFTPLIADEVDRVHRKNIGYEIAVLGRKDVFLESSNSEELASFGDYKFRGAVAHICDAGNDQAQYLLVNADYFASKGRLIFSAPHSIKAIEFTTKQNSELNITTQSDISGMKIYAPGVKKLVVNNKKHKFARKGDYVILM